MSSPEVRVFSLMFDSTAGAAFGILMAGLHTADVTPLNMVPKRMTAQFVFHRPSNNACLSCSGHFLIVSHLLTAIRNASSVWPRKTGGTRISITVSLRVDGKASTGFLLNIYV